MKGWWYVLETTTTKISLEEITQATEEFKYIREEIRTAISTLNPVELVTPKNFLEVKKDWIAKAKKGVFENPKFVYDKAKLKDALKKSEEVKDLHLKLLYREHPSSEPAKEFVWELLFSAISDAIGTVELAEALLKHDDARSKGIIARKYGVTGAENLKLAHESADTIKRRGTMDGSCMSEKIFMEQEDFDLLENSKLRACEIKQMFEWTMCHYGDADLKWPVEILENCSAIDVRDKSSFGYPLIAIPIDREVTGWKLAELLGHEIECHWRNSVNAELIGALKGDDEMMYEGLAMLKDNRFNRLYLGEDKWPQPFYILSQELALQGKCFAEVAAEIYQMLPKTIKARATKAWIYTYRAFRGIADTQNPHAYAFTKDRGYFEGAIYANELKMKGLDEYLSFGTLKKDQIERLIELTDVEDVKHSVLRDKNLQQRAIEKMLKCLRYGNAHRSTALTEVKEQTTVIQIRQPVDPVYA